MHCIRAFVHHWVDPLNQYQCNNIIVLYVTGHTVSALSQTNTKVASKISCGVVVVLVTQLLS